MAGEGLLHRHGHQDIRLHPRHVSFLIIGRTTSEFFPRCVQYWPAAKNREEVYGGVGITVESEEQLANFMIRFALSLTQILTFVFCRTIVLRKDGEERKVIQ